VAGSQWRRAIVIGTGVVGLVLGAAMLTLLVEPPHPGGVHYKAYCGECHDRDGVLAILSQQADDVDRLFATTHVERYVADPDERAQLIVYLKREMGG